MLCPKIGAAGADGFGENSWNEGCMWDSDQFKDYLIAQGHPAVWDDTIYPGMKRVINLTMLASQEIVTPRKASFELFGADFIIDEVGY